MPIAILTFSNSLNSSLQVGDIVYYSTLTNTPNSGFSTSVTGGMTKLGTVISMSINPIQVNVLYTDVANGGVNPPSDGDYIMFEKDKQVNSSSLIGYYADIKLVNNSKEDITLFSLGSEVSESSK